MYFQAHDAVNALTAARKACRDMGHPFMCSEHILIGLAEDESGESARFLRRRGITVGKLKKAALALVGKGSQPVEAEWVPPPSLRALGALRLAEDMASSYSKPVNSVYLLWAILQDRDSDAAELLLARGADLTAWTSALEELMGEPTRRRPRVFALAGTTDRPHGQAEAKRWRDKLKGARDYLKGKIVGQELAVERVAAALVRSWAGLSEAGRPLASFLFAGPRGAGKTTLAQSLAEFLFDDPERLIRLNLDEFSDEIRAMRLAGHAGGSPQEQEGVLTTLAQEYPYSVLYLEEADRAHPRALDVIHQILQRGHVIDGRGQRVEFRDNVVILSVAVDPDLFDRDQPVGFRLSDRHKLTAQDKIERGLTPDIERALSSECLELVDDLIMFPPLGRQDLAELVDKWTADLTRRLKQRRGVKVLVRGDVREFLVGRAEVGAEQAGTLRRMFVREVENRLARAMLEETFVEGDSIEVHVEKGTLVARRKGPSTPRRRKRTEA
ncbi:MAG: AAA family ATPase [Candidatus Eremiobacterota bacterium]